MCSSSKWQCRKITNLCPPMDITNLQLHMEQILLKKKLNSIRAGKKMKKSEDSWRGLLYIKQTNIYITDVPEGKEGEKETEKLFEAMKGRNFSNLGNKRGIQMHEVQGSMSKFKEKEKCLKAARVKTTYNIKENSHRTIRRFLSRPEYSGIIY